MFRFRQKKGLPIITMSKFFINRMDRSSKYSKINNIQVRTKKNRIIHTLVAIILILMPMSLFFWDVTEKDHDLISIDGEFDDWAEIKINSDPTSDQVDNGNVNIVNFIIFRHEKITIVTCQKCYELKKTG